MKARTKSRSRTRRMVRPALQIDPAGDWRACTATIPKDCDVLGTVTTSDGTTGALVRLATTHALVKVTQGDIVVLNQTKVRLALDAIARRGQSPAVEMIATATWRQPGAAS
jgi:hypothetical protein